MKFRIAKLQTNILKTYQKKLKDKIEKQQQRIKLNGREKVNTNLCYDGKVLSLGKLSFLK